MKFIYKNNRGEVRIGVGEIWRAKTASGLGFSPREPSTIRLVNLPGVRTLSEYETQRTITFALDLKGSPADEINALRVLDLPGILTVSAHGRERVIGARVAAFERTDKHGGGYSSHALQITCDKPYFNDPVNTIVPALGITPQIATFLTEAEAVASSIPYYPQGGKFTTIKFPMAVSILTNVGEVVIGGDRRVEPVFHIVCTGANAITKLTIENATTGQKITLNGSISSGENIRIDIAKREITSNLRTADKMLAMISTDTFLSDFWLDVGDNIIKTETVGDGVKTLFVTCEYNNNYMEAIV